MKISPTILGDEKGTPSLYDLTIAMDFINEAFRAIAQGHALESFQVREPILFAHRKCQHMAAFYGQAVENTLTTG